MTSDVTRLNALMATLNAFTLKFGHLLPSATVSHIGSEHERPVVSLPLSARNEAFTAFPDCKDWESKANTRGTFDAIAIIDGVEVIIHTFAQ
jgi:hypothetical protein